MAGDVHLYNIRVGKSLDGVEWLHLLDREEFLANLVGNFD
jgi:hypothetical protein